MTQLFKNILRKYLKQAARVMMQDTERNVMLNIDKASKYGYANKVAQRSLFIQYQNIAQAARRNGGGWLPSVDDVGYRVFSQFDEDGIFVFLFAVLGTHSNTFVDIGSADGINSNCANLAINFGWHGLL